MSQDQAAVLSHASNVAVVQLPGRNYPGSVIQGDSLHSLTCTAKVILERARQFDDEELSGECEWLVELLEGRLAVYKQVLTEHGIDLPFNDR